MPAVLAGCGGWSGSGPGCRALAEPAPLPPSLKESSGVAASRSRPGVYWTLNDGSGPVLYAVTAGGELRDSVVLRDTPDHDWEDLALAPCGEDGPDCLWIADTGDNDATRESAVIYRVAEPGPGVSAAGPAEAFPVRFSGEPRDVEAMFILPGGAVHLVSKGGDSPPAVYRYPPPLRPGETVTLEEVQRLDERTRALPRQITGASAAPDGRTVVVRTYETLVFMTVDDDGRLRALPGGTASLRTLREAQGEGVGLGADGEVVLTSEAGPLGERGSIVVMRCRPPEPESAGP